MMLENIRPAKMCFRFMCDNALLEQFSNL